jgi:hypothetical protein
VAQRHVDEHHLAQPLRLRDELLGRRRRDQAVEQHHGSVRDPPQRLGEGGVPRGAGPGPRAGDAVLVDLPPERREPLADLTVVGVAAARARGIVDAREDDDVDLRHSGRS